MKIKNLIKKYQIIFFLGLVVLVMLIIRIIYGQ